MCQFVKYIQEHYLNFKTSCSDVYNLKENQLQIQKINIQPIKYKKIKSEYWDDVRKCQTLRRLNFANTNRLLSKVHYNRNNFNEISQEIEPSYDEEWFEIKHDDYSNCCWEFTCSTKSLFFTVLNMYGALNPHIETSIKDFEILSDQKKWHEWQHNWWTLKYHSPFNCTVTVKEFQFK